MFFSIIFQAKPSGYPKVYKIKGEILGDSSHKYIAFFPPDGEQFIRGSEKSLGAEYTKERISERIAEAVQKRKKLQINDYTTRRFIDTSQDKFQESAGLKQMKQQLDKLNQYLGREETTKSTEKGKNMQSP